MVYVFHRHQYKGSLDRLKQYDSLKDVRAACIKKIKEDIKGSSRVSYVYVIRKEDRDSIFGNLGVVGWMDGERSADRKNTAFWYYTGKRGYHSLADKIRIGENGETYKSNINRKLASPYNRAKGKKKKEDNWHPFGL